MSKKYKYPQNRLNPIWLLGLFFLPAICFSQILNGSFEKDGQPSLDHWIISCEEGQPFQDAPSGGGVWCLRLVMGNYQGCFPGTAEQIIQDVGNGDVIQVSVWVKQDEIKVSPTSIYLKIYNAKGETTSLSVDTTSSKEWTQLTVTDTLNLNEGDSVAIVLDPGMTSGPQIINSDSYFDLVEKKKIGELVSLGDDLQTDHPVEFRLFQNYPNPFNPSTTISFTLPTSEFVTLEVYNILGQKVETLLDRIMAAGTYDVEFDASRLPSGIYFYRMKAGAYYEIKRMVLLL